MDKITPEIIVIIVIKPLKSSINQNCIFCLENSRTEFIKSLQSPSDKWTVHLVQERSLTKWFKQCPRPYTS